ncbi:21778_t:CDS:1, partial [Dentiscutata erythropus]
AFAFAGEIKSSTTPDIYPNTYSPAPPIDTEHTYKPTHTYDTHTEYTYTPIHTDDTHTEYTHTCTELTCDDNSHTDIPTTSVELQAILH